MEKRNDFMLYPEGKKKALTFSYDDGVVQDRRLVKLFNDYRVKCTFNLNSDVLGYKGASIISGKNTDISKVEPVEIERLYEGHEVAGHGLCHSFLQNIGTPTAMYEIIEDRRKLEKLSGKLVRFFAYPFGTYNEDVKTILHLAGYVGARTIESTHSFDVPNDFLQWNPTCHHNDPELMKLAKSFCEDIAFGSQLFYIWGHAYEFDADDNWDVIENFLKYVTGYREKIWFATNIQIADYINAFKQRIYSADGSLIYNPTATDIWLETGRRNYCIPSGKTVEISDSGL